MLGNRPEFHVCDLAVVHAGGTSFSIYATSSPEQIEYVVGDAGARSSSPSRPTSARSWPPASASATSEHVIVVDGEAPEGTTPLADLEAAGRPRASTSRRRWRSSAPRTC